jgi:peptidyl-dipeptidase A
MGAMRNALSLTRFLLAGAASSFSAGLVHAATPAQERADDFLAFVNSGYQTFYRIDQEAQWAASTDVTPAHDAASEVAGKALAAFNGNPVLINQARALLAHRAELDPLTVRELERTLRNAAEGPMTNPGLVAARVAAETQQASTMNGFEFKLNGKPVTTNQIDDLLESSHDLAERRAVWEASKESGPALKPGLIKLRDLRNGVAQELGYADYFSLQMAAYDMNAADMVKMNDDFMRELRPLYLQLHTWAKYALAKKYGQPVPKLIPAHWINNRWGQEWTGLVEAADLNPYFKSRSAEWVVQTAERFWTGIGFTPLPPTFWQNSDLYALPANSIRKKNTHGSCWHIDLDTDIRSLMSVEPNQEWFSTAHHELGHGHYFTAYTRPGVPYLLRDSANPGFHEGMAELGELASAQVPYLQQVGVLPADFKADEVAFLLNDALSSSIPFMYWASGTMTHWEADVYAGKLPTDQWNVRWWKYVRDFQGIEPPAPRGEEWCDAATKTHINDTPCYYPNYAFATVVRFQLHDYIARRILHQPPQHCNYLGNPQVGAFLKSIMEKGATQDWRKVLREATGEDISTRAMLEYFQPLHSWLEEQNKGRPIGWE